MCILFKRKGRIVEGFDKNIDSVMFKIIIIGEEWIMSMCLVGGGNVGRIGIMW